MLLPFCPGSSPPSAPHSPDKYVSCCCLVPKSCLTLLQPIDCSLLGSSVHGISQAVILEWVANDSCEYVDLRVGP